MTVHVDSETEELRRFAKHWNELYAAARFDDMELLATEDVGIANASAATSPTGLIYGRAAYRRGIEEAYGNNKNILRMSYEEWEYIPAGENQFYTIGRYTLQPDTIGVNCWLLRRASAKDPWRIYRVINN
jgi:hypothetical protein